MGIAASRGRGQEEQLARWRGGKRQAGPEDDCEEGQVGTGGWRACAQGTVPGQRVPTGRRRGAGRARQKAVEDEATANSKTSAGRVCAVPRRPTTASRAPRALGEVCADTRMLLGRRGSGMRPGTEERQRPGGESESELEAGAKAATGRQHGGVCGTRQPAAGGSRLQRVAAPVVRLCSKEHWGPDPRTSQRGQTRAAKKKIWPCWCQPASCSWGWWTQTPPATGCCWSAYLCVCGPKQCGCAPWGGRCQLVGCFGVHWFTANNSMPRGSRTGPGSTGPGLGQQAGGLGLM